MANDQDLISGKAAIACFVIMAGTIAVTAAYGITCQQPSPGSAYEAIGIPCEKESAGYILVAIAGIAGMLAAISAMCQKKSNAQIFTTTGSLSTVCGILLIHSKKIAQMVQTMDFTTAAGIVIIVAFLAAAAGVLVWNKAAPANE